MKYLCLIYLEEKKLDAMSQSESDALIDESLAYDEVLRKSGHYLVSGLHDRRSLLGRFILINARDLNDAIQVASQIPVARLGASKCGRSWSSSSSSRSASGSIPYDK